ncbi:CIC11C00000000716 [Sungouiella intermedia]|uniref:CIC11C00000000716 n=1 Tax=Sungouiella intermedia TaxID=45354 RepID=A0A1L0DYE2_9ASCO|nr:CIC11C00000000716 [[Candida] intermedia]
MSAASRAKRNRPHGGAMVPESNSLLSRKEENVQLHDEADLVNFRTDAYTRFVNNQDLLENVTLKPFHTLAISPPSSFPVHSKPKYEDSATDEEVLKVLKEMKPDELFLGDLRLMKAKMLLSLKELHDAEKEFEELSPKVVFSEKTIFQGAAIEKLASLQRSCNDMEALEALNEAMEETLAQYKRQFSGTLEVQQESYKKFSVPVSELAPDLEVKQAPPLYNPRLIMSFIDINGEPNNRGMGGQAFNENANMLLDTEKLAGQLPFMNNGMQGNDDFSMMMELEPKSGNAASRHPSGPASVEYSSATPYSGSNYNVDSGNFNQTEYANENKAAGPGSSGPGPIRNNNQDNGGNEDVNMDELNQFLAEPTDNDAMVDMDALMNFDQDNDNGEGLIGDNEFNVNFLSQMDNDM